MSSSTETEPTSSPSLPADLLERLSPDPAKRIEEVVGLCRRNRQPVELFEALKMQTRNRLGLPMVAPAEEPSSAANLEVERALEDGLLDACRQAGAMLIEDGKVGEGWMYMRPTGDTELVRRLISSVEVTEDNYDEMVHVLLHEGVDIARGYQAVIENQGTCNSITLYDQVIAQRGRGDRQLASECLLNHFYDELLGLVREDFSHRAGDNSISSSQVETDLQLGLGDLITKHKWILGGGGYHLDTTHLASAVRFATVLDDPESVGRALELCQYGRRLPADFQYPGDEPFVDFYPAHTNFFGALLGQNVDAALRVFEQKARSVDIGVSGSGAVETYIDLLDRVGRPAEALRAAIELFPTEVPTQRVMPELVAMAKRAKEAGDESVGKCLEEFCFSRGDLLGVAAASEL